jgi:hypothetical protein
MRVGFGGLVFVLVVMFEPGIWGFGVNERKVQMRLTGVSGVHIWRFTDAVLPAFTGFLLLRSPT